MMENKIFISIIFISSVYIFLVIYFRGNKIRQVITKNDVNQTIGKNDAIKGNVISSPNKLIVNLLYNEKEDLNLEIFSDMSIRFNDLINGTYKVPEHLKSGKTKDAIQAKDTTNLNKENKGETKLKINDIQFENLIDMSKKNKQV